MKFCYHITSELNFEPQALQPCCNTKALRRLPHFPFAGGKVDLDAYRRAMTEAVRELQSGGSMCAGCEYLVDIDVPEALPWTLDLRFMAVSINMHRYLCNCRCVYCDFWKTPGLSYDLLPALKSLKAGQALRDDCVFSWGGGEPTILPEFAAAGRWIADNGHWQYVHSNALRYSPALTELLREGRAGLNVSLDSGQAATYARIKGRDKFDQVLENLGRYAEAMADIRNLHLKYIVFDLNNSPEEVAAFFARCRQLGVVSVQLSLDFREVNSNSVSEDSFRAAALFERLAAANSMRCEHFFMNPAHREKVAAYAKGRPGSGL